MSNYGEQFMKCPECSGTAESDCVDVGVGLYIRGNYVCACGWEYEADGMMNVSHYEDYFCEEPQMAYIYFTQFLRPNGEKRMTRIDRPISVVARADHIQRQGFRFEIEELITGQIHMTISDDDGDYDSRICDNGPMVPLNVDDMLLNFNLPAAIKQREKNRH